jgi:hypothetical protein
VRLAVTLGYTIEDETAGHIRRRSNFVRTGRRKAPFAPRLARPPDAPPAGA